MAITLYKSSDPGAPTLSGTAPERVAALLRTVLVSGYVGKPGAGWSVIHDTFDSVGGSLILETPSGAIYVVKHINASTIELGMAAGAEPDGTLMIYKSGHYNGTSGTPQRLIYLSTYHTEFWLAYYDENSETTFIYASSDVNNTYASQRDSSTWDRGLNLYLGTLKPLPGEIYAPHVVFGGGVRNSDYDNRLCNANSSASNEAQPGTILRPYPGELIANADTAVINTHYQGNLSALGAQSSFPFVALEDIPVLMYRGGLTPETIGYLRGVKYGPRFYMTSQPSSDEIAKIFDPNVASYSNYLDNPLQIDGHSYYPQAAKSSRYYLLGDNPEWW